MVYDGDLFHGNERVFFLGKRMNNNTFLTFR